MDFSSINVVTELAPVLALGVTIVTGLAVLIPLRKTIKTINRS